jgi:hypothetical protein
MDPRVKPEDDDVTGVSANLQRRHSGKAIACGFPSSGDRHALIGALGWPSPINPYGIALDTPWGENNFGNLSGVPETPRRLDPYGFQSSPKSRDGFRRSDAGVGRSSGRPGSRGRRDPGPFIPCPALIDLGRGADLAQQKHVRRAENRRRQHLAGTSNAQVYQGSAFDGALSNPIVTSRGNHRWGWCRSRITFA